jgi:hypothetical protein
MTERLGDFLSHLDQAMHQHAGAVREAAHISNEIKDEIRAKQQAQALRQARSEFQKKANVALDEIRGDRMKAEQALKAKTDPRGYNDSMERLADMMMQQEIRQVMRGMPETKRSEMVRARAKAGDRTVLDAVVNSPDTLLQPTTIEAAQAMYARAVAKPELRQVEAEGEVERVARQIIENAERTLTHMEKAEDRILPAPEPEPGTAGMSTKEKTDFIREHGQNAYMDLHNNKTTLAQATA